MLLFIVYHDNSFPKKSYTKVNFEVWIDDSLQMKRPVRLVSYTKLNRNHR